MLGAWVILLLGEAAGWRATRYPHRVFDYTFIQQLCVLHEPWTALPPVHADICSTTHQQKITVPDTITLFAAWLHLGIGGQRALRTSGTPTHPLLAVCLHSGTAHLFGHVCCNIVQHMWIVVLRILLIAIGYPDD